MHEITARANSKTSKPGLFVILALLVGITSMFALFGCDSEKNEALDAFKAASAALEEKNAEVNAAIAELQSAMESEIRPLDESTATAAEEVISTTQGAIVSAPKAANDIETIKEQTAELEKVDYKAQLESIAEAKANLENSIKQRKQVTNPSEAFVIQRLAGVEHVVTPTAVTEDHDPNKQLNKQGGYTATVYFISDLVDQSRVSGETVIDKATDGGGAVEVYPDENGAQKRNEHLAGLDGGMLSSGSHSVCGTCVIRTSDLLTASQQKELEASVIKALTRLE